MSKENIGYYESNIQTSRNVENIKDARIDGVIAIKLWSLTKQVDNLIKENQELKEQLKIKHDGFMASIEEKCELADENQKLKEMQCTFLGTGCQNKMEKYKEVIDKAIKLINKCVEAQLEEDYLMNRVNLMNYNCNLLDILKEVYR